MSLYLYVSVSTLSVSVISTSVLIPTPILVPIPTLISPVGYCLSDGGGLVAKSCLTLATSWTVACQAPLSIEFSRQEYWSGDEDRGRDDRDGKSRDRDVEIQRHICKAM